MALVHHELCFGCGRTNLFGLLLEVHEIAPGLVRGRCFIKQDHQGPQPGTAHEGVITAALTDAMSLAHGGENLRAHELHVEFVAAASVGGFLDIEARARPATATALAGGTIIARATGTFGS